ncbi:MAG: SDR family oxidoreductase [Dehalococcoidia bacterium]|jgi:NAD(P)-dependent dehydrogenase (short-subunit alcohol dehydrogenase family)
MDLKGKVALITGGGSGIGTAVAKRFVADGAKICITGRRKEMLEKVAASFPKGMVTICQGDMAKEEDVKRMVEATVKFGGKIDVLVNNAALNHPAPVTDLPLEQWNHVIAVNLTGPFLLMKETIPYMLKVGGGSIINIASLGGLRCLPAMPAYCSSKAGLIMLTQQVALEYGIKNIRSNVVCPGGVSTEMTVKDFGEFGRMLKIEHNTFINQIAQEIPMRRFADPSEMGGLCSYLASDESSFMTGAVLVIDGGTAVVDAVGAGISSAMRRGGLAE